MDSQEKIKQLENTVARLEQASFQAEHQNAFSNQLGNAPYTPKYETGEELDLAELFAIVWKKKLIIAATAVVFAIASVFYALSLPNIYQSSALLMPNSQEQSNSNLAGLASQFGGLASLAGINLGGGGADKTVYALEVLESREFLYKFIKDNDLKLKIMAADGWDRGTDTFTYDSKIYDVNTKKWVRDVSAPYQPEPSIQETYETFIAENLSISQDKENSMVTISISHYSPYLAKELVEKLVESINSSIKSQDLNEATKSIAYLEKELQNTREVGMQSMFYQLIEKQQQTLMLTKVRNDYVLKIVDKAIVPEQKLKPKRAVIVVLGGLLGVILSSLIVLFYSFKVKK